MEKKTFSKVQIYVRENYNRSKQLFEAGKINDAIGALKNTVKSNPEVPVIFERLREYEIAKCRKQGGLIKALSNMFAVFTLIGIKLRSGGNPFKVLPLCEDPLARCVDNPLVLKTLANAADACEAPWITATALNVIKTFHPKDTANLKRLAIAFQQNGQARESLQIFQQIAKDNPGNLEIQKELREAMAVASMQRGKWEEEGKTQDKAADKSEAVMLQLLEGTIHDAEQAQMVIDKFTAELMKQDSVDMRRKLADAYMVAEKYDKAQAEYTKVAEKLGGNDPVLDKLIEKAYIAQLDQVIAQLSENPEAYENGVQQLEEYKNVREEFRISHAVQRAELFPNDMQLQFDLGELRFERNEIAEAKEIFAKIVENPQKRRPGLVYLGRCELALGDAAAAKKDIKTALDDMYNMDRAKREAMYYYANACEVNGDTAEALEVYKQIEGNLSGYRDVAERIAALSQN